MFVYKVLGVALTKKPPSTARMSTYQGACGPYGSPVLPSPEGMLSSTQRQTAKADAALYGHVNAARVASGRPAYQFASAADYLRYKKARVLANAATNDPYRGAPSAAIAAMQRAGCPTV
jgi:hypothetical protein